MIEGELEDVRLWGMYVGPVVDRNDPKRLGRVRVEIPGLLDNPGTTWAYPVGGGAKQRGHKVVPKLGAEVVVFFHQGDPDWPYYLPAHWGMPGGVTEMPGSSVDADGNALSAEEAPDVHAIETDDFVVYVDEREGKRGAVLRHKKTGDLVEYDGQEYGIQVKSTTAILISCDGMVSIEGNVVQINGRKVVESKDPI